MNAPSLVPAGFEPPADLTALVEEGVWPITIDDARLQPMYPLVGGDGVAHIDPQQVVLFQRPPLLLYADETPQDPEVRYVDDGGFDPEHTVVFAILGSEGDRALALDYQDGEPCVVCIEITGAPAPASVPPHLVVTTTREVIAPTFGVFIESIGLGEHGPFRWHRSAEGPGSQGREEGEIALDHEHSDGARLTVERLDDRHAITCDVYGVFAHTSFFHRARPPRAEVLAMKAALVNILRSDNPDEAIGRFKAEFS